MYLDYLEHHGVKGQRWGFRRFQPYPKRHMGGIEIGEAKRKSHRLSNRKRNNSGISRKTESDVSPIKKIRLERKARRNEAKQIKKQKRIEEEKRLIEEELREEEREKERVLREGTATEILKYKGDLTTKQLQDAAERIKWTNTLKDYSKKDITTYLDKVEKYANTLKRINNITSTAIDTKNNVDKIIGMFDKSMNKSNQSYTGYKQKQESDTSNKPPIIEELKRKKKQKDKKANSYSYRG